MRFGFWRRRVRRHGSTATAEPARRPSRVPAPVERLEPRALFSAVSFTTGTTIQQISALSSNIVTGDFNGDGLTDFVTARPQDDVVNVMLNDGSGGFTRVPIRGVTRPISVAVGDFNHDGNLDVAFTSSPTLSILNDNRGIRIAYGQGDDTFAAPVVVGHVRRGFGAITAADLNNDGLPDLVVTNISAVTVLLNNGDGTFAAPVRYPTAQGNATFVTAADLNGDGIDDLVVTKNNSNFISVLPGLGGGTFGHFARLRTGGRPTTVAVADVNGDQKPDLVVANGGFRAGISVLLNEGDFTFAPQTKTSAGNFPQGVALADFDGDGTMDAAVTNFFGPLKVFPGNGDGTFATPTEYFSGENADYITTADVNNDGKPDIILGHSGNITVLLNTSA